MRKISIWKKVLIGLLVTLFILIGGIFIYAKTLTSKMNRVDIDINDVTNTGQEVPKEANTVITIALFGTDYEVQEVGSTDSMMILAIDKANNKIKLCSLMRDMYIDLPDGGKSNLNYVVHRGDGIAGTIKAINYNFNLNVSKFVQVDLNNLPTVIDTLGGVELDITSDEIAYINGFVNHIDESNGTKTEKLTSAGKQLLNGTQAAAYCRIRSTEGRDYKRTERQRDVLNSLFNKVKSVSLLEVPGVVSKLLPLVTTNITDSEILSIASTVLSMNIDEIEQGRFPLDEHHTTTWTDMYHMIIDKEATTNEIHKFLFSKES